MKKKLLFFLMITLSIVTPSLSQSNINWKYLCSSNTGIDGDFVQTIEVDRFQRGDTCKFHEKIFNQKQIKLCRH